MLCANFFLSSELHWFVISVFVPGSALSYLEFSHYTCEFKYYSLYSGRDQSFV